jgi:hypothetical protein
VRGRQTEAPDAEEIRIELTRGATQLRVRWPSTQAAACAAWLRELAAVALKNVVECVAFVGAIRPSR